MTNRGTDPNRSRRPAPSLTLWALCNAPLRRTRMVRPPSAGCRVPGRQDVDPPDGIWNCGVSSLKQVKNQPPPGGAIADRPDPARPRDQEGGLQSTHVVLPKLCAYPPGRDVWDPVDGDVEGPGEGDLAPPGGIWKCEREPTGRRRSGISHWNWSRPSRSPSCPHRWSRRLGRAFVRRDRNRR